MEEICHDTCELSTLMDEYGNCVLNTAYLYVKDKQLAEDIFQEVFLKAYLKFNTFQARSSIKTWLIRITINLCKDNLKSTYKKKVTVGLDDITATSESAEKAAVEHIESERLYIAVMSLKQNYREVILLRYYNQLTPEEISTVLNIHGGTVRTRLFRATSCLKKILTD
ncbi:MAG: hypothetical protein A2Y15_05605 [Clostridiales bacterium GWF2_36_10]|nr:MAG: hypothetical protein A2Y15_05605 [Clostridiales bacterium GWF2_36_10]HAN21981.1 hypothetical protein [Clostridiales bacterium]